MKILVIGHAGHGKDTVCEMLRDDHGYSFQSSSEAAFDEVIWPVLKKVYLKKEYCWDSKDNDRKIWFDIISHYNTPDASRLVRKVLETSDIYCGLRSRREFEASRHLFRHIVWVDASERVPLESESSMKLNANDADVVVENNSMDLADLEGEVRELVNHLRRKPLMFDWSDRQRLYRSHFPVT